MIKKKVYVSSTFVDLKTHRRKIKEALEGAQYDVECMEKYPAFDKRPKDKCLEDVARCNYYVLIVAHRYGYVPRKDNPEKKSITQLEYEQAVASKKPVFAFISEDLPWPPKITDRNSLSARSRIGPFRNHVVENHGFRCFTKADGLATLVLQALRAHEEEERRTAGELQRPAPLPGFRWRTPWDFTAYVQSRREGFVGRKWLFNEIENWLKAGTQKGLLIRADFGVGKSAMMAEFWGRNPGGAVAAAHFCQHDTRETLEPAVFVRSLAAQFRDSIPGYREGIEGNASLQEIIESAQDTPAGAFDAAILNVLAKLPVPPNHRLLLVDALDEALELDREIAEKSGTIISLLSAKASRFPAWLRLLVTSRNNPAVISPLQQSVGIKEINAEDERNQADLDDYVKTRCSQEPIVSRLQAAGRTTESIVSLLRDKSEGKFLYAVRALNDLANENLKLDDLERLPPGMDGFYLDAFNRRFGANPKHYEEVRDALGVLAAAREPVAPAMLAGVLGRDETAVKQALAVIPDFVPVRNGGYILDHFSMAEWLTLENEQFIPRAGPYAVDLNASRERIRSWALRQVESKQAYKEPYLLRHLAAHLKREERAHALHTNSSDETLTHLYNLAQDEKFLQAQAELDVHLPLQTIQMALIVAGERNDGRSVAKLILNHARRVIRLGIESPLAVLRKENKVSKRRSLDKVWQITHLYNPERRILWHLLLAWELSESWGVENTQKALDQLKVQQLPRLSNWQGLFASYLLAHMLEVSDSVLTLCVRLLDNTSLAFMCECFIGRGHFAAAREAARNITNDRTRADVLLKLATAEARAWEFDSAHKTVQEIPLWEEKRNEVFGVIVEEHTEAAASHIRQVGHDCNHFDRALQTAKRIWDKEGQVANCARLP